MNNQFMQMLTQFKANPTSFLGNIPGVDMTNPDAIIQYGLNNGRFTQAQYNAVVAQAKQMGFIK